MMLYEPADSFIMADYLVTLRQPLVPYDDLSNPIDNQNVIVILSKNYEALLFN